jgi:hypothetical protein
MHRETHHFRMPCCLCPVKNGRPSTYVESKVFVMEAADSDTGSLGEYVSACASTDTLPGCGYIGKQILLLTRHSISLNTDQHQLT